MNFAAAQLLLDPERVLERIRELIPGLHDLQQAPTIDAIWVKPQRYFNVAFGWHNDHDAGVTLRLAGFVLPPPEARRAVRAAAHTCEGGETPDCPGCATFADEELVWQLFPHDYRLPALATCLRPEIMRPLLPEKRIVAAEAVGYRPGMRALIRYRTDDGGAVFGKLAHEREPRQYIEPLARAGNAARRAAGSLRLPRVLAYEARLGLGLIEGLSGADLYSLLRDGAPVSTALSRTAQALAELHDLAIEGVSRSYEARHELELLQPWIEVVENIGVGDAPLRREILTQLADTLPSTRPQATPVHRDFYDKQVLLADDHVVVLDLDTLACGDAEIDVANFTAHLFLRGVQAGDPTPTRAQEETFVTSYAAPIDTDRWRWYRRAALLRLSCVYALRPNGLAAVPALLAEAAGA